MVAGGSSKIVTGCVFLLMVVGGCGLSHDLVMPIQRHTDVLFLKIHGIFLGTVSICILRAVKLCHLFHMVDMTGVEKLISIKKKKKKIRSLLDF